MNKRPFRVGEWCVYPDLNRLSRDGDTVHVEPKVMSVLDCLAASPGQVVAKERFLREVWVDTFVGDEVLTHSISELRKALGDDAKAPRFIETIPKRGYRLIAPVHWDPGDRDEQPKSPWWKTARVAVSAATLSLAAVIGPWIWMGHREQHERPPLNLPLTSDPGFEEFPAISPDGNQVAFVQTPALGAASALMVSALGAGSNSRRQITSPAGSAPVWSPDGRTIAFARHTGADSGIYLIPADGADATGQRVLSAKWDHANLARLSWSGTFLAFAEQDAPGGPHHISLLSLQNRDKRRLTSIAETSAKAFGDFWPVFSPDGKMLAFIRSEKFLKEDLYVTSLEGSAERLLASGQSRILGISWSRDGREIVFSANRSGGFRMSLWRIAVAGGSPQPVPEADANALDPSISREGSRLVYTQAFFDTSIWRFPIATANGGASATRLINSTMFDYGPAYSPDGQRIAFESARSGEQEIWVCNADGSNPTQLTFRGVSPTRWPRWSPDGSLIAFDSRYMSHDQIWVIPSRGGEPRRLTDGSFHSDSPSWSRDGKWIYFTSRRTSQAEIWKIAIEGGPPIQVTTQGGGPAVESPDGRYLWYARDPSPGIWKVPVSGGPELQAYDLRDSDPSGKWAVMANGIYFVGRDERRHPALFFLDFATQQSKHVAVIDAGRIYGSIDVSADGRWLLAAITDDGSADLKLVEGFR